MNNILDCLQEGEEIEGKGPSGAIHYQKACTFEKVSLTDYCTSPGRQNWENQA